MVTQEIAAEAAVWIARLHGPDRSSKMEQELREWLERSAVHRYAFERCTETWMSVPNVTLADAFAAMAAERGALPKAPTPWMRRRWALVTTVAALAIAGAGVLHLWSVGTTYTTGVGEQKIVVLDDGTRVSLNTGTELSVQLSAAQRTVSVRGGEALFEVAKDAHRPFIVRAGGAEVVAVGTVFAVRLTSDGALAARGLAVTLLEGRVDVRPTQGVRSPGLAPTFPLVLQPGERVRLRPSTTPPDQGTTALQVDKPQIEQLIAWRHGEAVFDDASLPDAVAEMNRYSRTPIVLASGADLMSLHVSGQFRTGDNLAFAKALSRVHGLTLLEGNGRLELAPTN